MVLANPNNICTHMQCPLLWVALYSRCCSVQRPLCRCVDSPYTHIHIYLYVYAHTDTHTKHKHTHTHIRMQCPYGSLPCGCNPEQLI